MCEIFVSFCIEFSGGQLSKGFLFVLKKVGAPNNHGTASVGSFDDDVVPSFKILVGSPFFCIGGQSILLYWWAVRSSVLDKIALNKSGN